MDKAKGKDHSEYCWSCGKHSMAPVKSYFQCTECGATWNPTPEPGHPALTYRELPGHLGVEAKPYGTPWYD